MDKKRRQGPPQNLLYHTRVVVFVKIGVFEQLVPLIPFGHVICVFPYNVEADFVSEEDVSHSRCSILLFHQLVDVF